MSESFEELPNLGPKSRVMLQQAGITTFAQLHNLGAVAAFSRVRRSGANATLNLLWALEGALTGLPWQAVAREHRTSLLLALEQHERDDAYPFARADGQRHGTLAARC
ncbi:TfoX/Sxy family protein [Piscinibacter defluvii]|uniref:TfoX/Sxy family protein n=1 Tax=Piscinibacter defluvii TaxID=1796922 RepID=UPI00197C2671|nr:TfoX/Sxy family protein [Piscinibacter defluvii]